MKKMKKVLSKNIKMSIKIFYFNELCKILKTYKRSYLVSILALIF